MPKVKLTKNALKRQRDALKRFDRYLPTLKLRKQQLQIETGKTHHVIEELNQKMRQLEDEVSGWVGVFAENINIRDFLKIEGVDIDIGNVAGIDIPVFLRVNFQLKAYDLLRTPLWVDAAIAVCKEAVELKARLYIARNQLEILQQELRIAVQRVNLFEKVKIPQAKENIRVISIYLGDMQTAEVVRGKIAKTKIERKKAVLAL